MMMITKTNITQVEKIQCKNIPKEEHPDEQDSSQEYTEQDEDPYNQEEDSEIDENYKDSDN